MTDREQGEREKSRSQQFEELVAEVFRAHNFKVDEQVRYQVGGATGRADLVLTWANEIVTAVEVKLYRSRARYLPDADQAIAQVRRAQAALKADNAMIVTNLYRDRLSPTAVLDDEVVLVGIDDLAALTTDPELRERIGQMDEELSSALGDFDNPGLKVPAAPFDSSVLHMKAGVPVSVPAITTRGADLKTDLLAIETGKTHTQTLPSGRTGANWRLFEDVCYEALQYVFEGVLGNWDKQKPVAGDDNRFDAIAKIQGSDVFCRTLIEHFGCRHILFEFKNYGDPIGPNLIHITEKYLYPKALRGTAIIISPHGFDDAARRASHGALRDVGKLMLDLTMMRLCSLLDKKDKAQPPGGTMENLLDNFLLEVGR